jgi:hypothetical protein
LYKFFKFVVIKQLAKSIDTVDFEHKTDSIFGIFSHCALLLWKEIRLGFFFLIIFGGTVF